MRIRIDAHHAAEIEGAAVPAPVQIEPPRVGVDLHGNPVLRTGGEDRLDIHFITGAAQKLPPGHVAEDGGERILDRTDYALRLRLAVELETAVHACDHKIKAGQNVVRVVEGAVGEDVGLDAFEDAEALAVPSVELVDLRVLGFDLLDRQATSVM